MTAPAAAPPPAVGPPPAAASDAKADAAVASAAGTAPASASAGGGEQELEKKDEDREQDRYLPIANISRIMKKALPPNAKIAKDAKETVQECVSEFISFVTSEGTLLSPPATCSDCMANFSAAIRLGAQRVTSAKGKKGRQLWGTTYCGL